MWGLTIYPLRGSASSLPLVPLQSMWDLTIYTPSRLNILAGTLPSVHLSLRLSASLAHRSVSSSNTICNSSSPPLTDIVLLGLSLRFPHPYKEYLVFLSNRYEILQSTSFKTQRPSFKTKRPSCPSFLSPICPMDLTR